MKNWDSIRYYLAVARQGTVSGAAAELAATHATALKRIELFEGDLDEHRVN
jgi:DNA-binding transcriptional LysR family regulator